MDSSALLAILFREQEHLQFLEHILRSETARVSAASVLETSTVIDSRIRAGEQPSSLVHELDSLISDAKLENVPVHPVQINIARLAYRMLGKGSGHAAQLNFGDCFAYALAIHLDEPLLFKGDDFVHTDVKTVT